MIKKVVLAVLVLLIAFSLITNAEMKILLEEREENVLSEGIKYIYIQKNTVEGPLDIHILKVDLDEEYVDLRPIYTKETSVRKPLSNIASSWNATGAINGDFFQMGSPSFTYGTLIDQDKIISTPNSDTYNYPTIIREGNNFDFSIIKTSMRINVGNSYVALASINKVGALNQEVFILNSAFGKHSLGSNESRELFEAIVINNVVTSVHIGENPVEIPEEGYVVVFNSKNESYKNLFKVGAKLEIGLDFGFDLNNIDWAAGGVNYLLKDGKVNDYNNSVLGRQPRSAIGFDKEQKTAYLVTVDGRGTESIGVRQSELAEILIEIGCFNAVNLDGGGSAEMVVKFSANNEYTVVNNPSDGKERIMVSGFGAFNLYPESSEIKHIEISVPQDGYFKNQQIKYEVKAYNKYYIPVDIDRALFRVSTTGLNGKIGNGEVVFTESGKGIIKMNYKALEASAEVMIYEDIEQIYSSVNEISVYPNEQYRLSGFIGVDGNGNTGPVSTDEIKWSVSNLVGKFADGVFVGNDKAASGILTGKVGNAEINIPVYVGYQEKELYGFENIESLILNQYPEDSKGEMSLVVDRNIEGKSSLKLSYDFTTMKPDDQSIAFVEFGEKGINLEGEPKSISMWVYGDSSKHWLRCRVEDAKGNLYKIDFEEEIDWSGWKQVTAKIPDGITYPIILKNVYIAEISNEKADKGTIYIDKLTAEYSLNKLDEKVIPQNTTVNDKLKKIPSRYDYKFISDYTGLYLANNIGEYGNSIGSIKAFNIDIAKGGIGVTNSAQWDKLISLKDVKNSDVIIKFNVNFNQIDSKEKLVLERFFNHIKNTGNNNVFVLSPPFNGNKSSIYYQDGVRYINYIQYFELYSKDGESSFYFY